MKVSWWQLIGSLWTAWWLFIVLWITWYDYPRTTDIYAGFLGDGTWFWHEIAIPIGIWLSGMAWIVLIQLGMYLYRLHRLMAVMIKRIEKGL